MTATATAKSTLPVGKLNEVIERMRNVQSEGDRWELADALKKMIPSGTNGFDEIIDRASGEGIGGLTATTLRLYRDTAERWPTAKRVKNVSFSAHREAMVLPTIEQRVKMLGDLSKTLGAPKVTVASVRKAVAVKQGKKPTATAAKGSAKSLDILTDLIAHKGAGLISAIGNETDTVKLDGLNAGLTKVLAHVEKLRAKAARVKKPVAKVTPAAKKATTNGKSKTKRADMRGL